MFFYISHLLTSPPHEIDVDCVDVSLPLPSFTLPLATSPSTIAPRGPASSTSSCVVCASRGPVDPDCASCGPVDPARATSGPTILTHAIHSPANYDCAEHGPVTCVLPDMLRRPSRAYHRCERTDPPPPPPPASLARPCVDLPVYHPVAIHPDHIHPMVVTRPSIGVLRPIDQLVLTADVGPTASLVPFSVRAALVDPH
jgi:hypothetical protein